MFELLHPGEIVKDALIDATGLSPDMALRLAKLLKTSIDMWINLQAQYDTWQIAKQYDDVDVKPLVLTKRHPHHVHHGEIH